MCPELMEAPQTLAHDKVAFIPEERLADAFAESVSLFHFNNGPHSGRRNEVHGLIKAMFEADDLEEVHASLAFAVGIWDEGFRLKPNRANFGLFNPKLAVDYPPLRVNETAEDVIDGYLQRGYAIMEEAEGMDEFFKWFSEIQERLENSVDN